MIDYYHSVRYWQAIVNQPQKPPSFYWTSTTVSALEQRKQSAA